MSAPTVVPFVIRRAHSVVRGREVTETKEASHGLLRLEAGRVVAQWSTARQTLRAGSEVRVDHSLGPVREVVLPVGALAGARVTWRWGWRPRWQLVLQAADLQAFAVLAGEAGLLLEHPAELALDIRRADRALAREFAADLALALAEASLQAVDGPERLPPGGRSHTLPP